MKWISVGGIELLSPKEKINAVTWKSEQLGVSYGRFVNQCTEHEMSKVYREYEMLLQERRDREQKWMNTKKHNSRSMQDVE